MKVFIKKALLALVVTFSGLLSCYAALPEVKTVNEVSYIVGGSTNEETKFLEEEGKKWPLSIEFRRHTYGEEGELLSGVNLAIINQDGKSVFDQTLDGPIFLAKLIPGEYELFAMYQGVVKKQTVKIKKDRHHRKFFIWRAKKKSK